VKVKIESYNDEKDLGYPSLRVHRGTVVLFEKPGCGMCVAPELELYYMTYRNDWITDNFKPFNGVLKLSND
jgi:hypothetical protein